MDTFIVRPFGKKTISKTEKATGKTLSEILFDFDLVEALLLAPALEQVNISGGTTGRIFEPGDIRADMFSLLLMADIVIADITIHNANVFYELGIRHALRDKKTILIKCPGFDDTPFDILGYRYVSYDRENPAAAVPALVQTLKDTLLSDRKDSPVYNMLPKLEAQDTERFLAVPLEFAEEVEVARKCGQSGRLALLAEETTGFAWQLPALRAIGEAQFELRAFRDATATWEKIRSRYPYDIEANDRLATIFQRLAEAEMPDHESEGLRLLAQSDLAVERLLQHYDKLSREKRAETFALEARNFKTRWVSAWQHVPEEKLLSCALQSPYLQQAFQYYQRGYNEDLNHYYSGINALALLTVLIGLAEAIPDQWELEHDTPEDAALKLSRYKTQHRKLAIVLETSLEAEKQKQQREGKSDPWLPITEADLACLTHTKPEKVGLLYRKAIQGANNLNFDAARRQLQLYKQLQVQAQNVAAALAEFSASPEKEAAKKRHYLLFTGHMIDAPDRPQPRFPAEQEAAAKAAIRAAVLKEQQRREGALFGIAGGASGGDILFHEVCEELGIPTGLYLALPREQFLVASVQGAGPAWVERFDRLYRKLKHQKLSDTKELPKWLQKKTGYSIWERANLWMLHSALVCGGLQMTLIALWDGKGGDGAGGTEHMVQEAQKRGAKTVIISTAQAFSLAGTTT